MEEKILTTEELMKYCHFCKKVSMTPPKNIDDMAGKNPYFYWKGELLAILSNENIDERHSLLGTFKSVGEPGTKLAPHLPKILIAGLFEASQNGSDGSLSNNAIFFENVWFPDYIESTKM